MYLRAKGIINGYPDGTFKPNQVVNRAETLKMILGIKNFKYWDKATDVIFGGAKLDVKFSDIDLKAWYMEFLQIAFNDSLIQGYADGTFKPAQTVNLVENLKILLNHTFLRIDKLDAVKVEANPYADAMMSEWYAKYVQYAKDKGLLDADASNRIMPAQGMTRAKLAEVIYRVLYIDSNGLDKYVK
jgi:predicted DNA-binding antitoxin AbrB/MazE fold protein